MKMCGAVLCIDCELSGGICAIQVSGGQHDPDGGDDLGIERLGRWDHSIVLATILGIGLCRFAHRQERVRFFISAGESSDGRCNSF